MHCKKCGGPMKHEAEGYNITRGDIRAVIYENYTCILCGNFVESVPETVIDKKLLSEKREYPKQRARQPLSSDPWLQRYVKDHLEEITKLRKLEFTWREICTKLNSRDNMKLAHDSISGAFRKVSRGC